MKSLLICISALVLASCLPPLVTFTEPEYHAEVYEDVSGTQDQLYLKASSWMISTFNNAESVVQHSDKTDGVIIGKYLMHGGVYSDMNGTVDTRVYAIIDVRVKQERARIEIKPQGSWRIHGYSKDDAKREMVELTHSFHTALLKEDVEF